MAILSRKDSLTKGHKHSAKGLSLFHAAIDKLEVGNLHLLDHADIAESAAANLTAQAEQARAAAAKNQGVIERLHNLLGTDA